MRFAKWIVVGLMFAAPTVRAADAKPATPTVLVQIQSIDGLIAGAKYIATLAGHGEQANQVEKMLPQFLGAKGLGGTGIDTTKPWGFYGILDPQIPNSPVVVLIPVTDEKTFVDSLTTYAGFAPQANVKIAKGDDGIYSVTSAAPVAVYFTVADGYAYFTGLRQESIAKANRLDAGKLLTADDKTLVRATARLDAIDPTFKQIALGQFENQVAAAKEQSKPKETAAQKKLRGDVIDYVSGQVKSLLTDGQAVDFRLVLDRKVEQIGAELTLTAAPGSPLAQSIAAAGKRESRFGPLNGSAGYAALNVALPEPLRGPLMAAVEEGFNQQQAGQKDAVKKALGQKAFDALKPTLEAEELDLFVALLGPNSAGRFTAAGGIKLKDAPRVDQLVRDLIKIAPDPKAQEAIKFDAETVGEVKVHRVDPPELDAEAKRIFGGDAVAFFAFPTNAQVAAFGADAAQALRQVLAATGKPGGPFRAEGSVGRLAGLDKDAGAAAKKAAGEAFGSDHQSDIVRISVSGGELLRLRASMKTQVIKFGVKMDEAKKGGQ
ncbi:MAG TPA: hypothetical protein VH120_02185 [Gemmataceae bacterium]|nr:hypothetical protein [Gemmataceae bacterium]